MLCVMFEHGVTYVRVGCADDVFTTVTDVTRTSVYKHGLRVRYIWQIQQGRTYRELNGTQRQVME